MNLIWSTYDCWHKGLNLGLQWNNWLSFQSTTIYHCNICYQKLNISQLHHFFYKSNFKMYFLPHILFKQNKWKFILEVFSKVYMCIINKHTKFQIIWKKVGLHCLITIQNTFIHKQNDLITCFINRLFYNEFWNFSFFLCKIIYG
jgi:hypothetical protein